MRTTVDLADDVAAEIARMRREQGLGLSEAVNALARAGLNRRTRPYAYQPTTYDMAARVDLTDIGEVLELLDEGDGSDGRSSARSVG